jgi:prepilin-type N-terminal cleavage/methylation domain-containing protein
MKSVVKSDGFSIIEMLIAIGILAILAILPAIDSFSAKRQAQAIMAKQQSKEFAKALDLYLADNMDVYPPDVDRGVYASVTKYFAIEGWPREYPWPGSIYDWDNWIIPVGQQNAGENVVQLSIRFCNQDGSNCRFPNEPWARNFDQWSAAYWCFKGHCRSHADKPYNHPGYCMNCQSN